MAFKYYLLFRVPQETGTWYITSFLCLIPCMHACIYMYACMHKCVCVCVRIHVHTWKSEVNLRYCRHQPFSFFFTLNFILCAWALCLHVCLCTLCMPNVHRGQKRLLNPLELELTDGCQLSCGCWELNPNPRRTANVIKTAELALQPHQPWFLI